MPTQTLIENQYWCLDSTVMWGVLSAQARILWKFTILSLVNPTFISKQSLQVNFREHRACTMIRMSEDLHSLDVVWETVKSSDKGNTETLSSCNWWHTGSGNFFHSSQYTNFHSRSSRPTEQRTKICSVVAAVSWIICGMGVCVEATWHSHSWNARLPFPELNNEIPLQNHIKRVSKRKSITTPTVSVFSLAVHKQCLFWVYWDSHSTCKER
jgi:hypothetical protein